MLNVLIELGLVAPEVIKDIEAGVAALKAAANGEAKIKAALDGLKQVISDIESAL